MSLKGTLKAPYQFAAVAVRVVGMAQVLPFKRVAKRAGLASASARPYLGDVLVRSGALAPRSSSTRR